MVGKVLLLGMVITGRVVADEGVTVAFLTPVTAQKKTTKQRMKYIIWYVL